jgi:RNA polymerase sigma-70 factor (ECF subfamily)
MPNIIKRLSAYKNYPLRTDKSLYKNLRGKGVEVANLKNQGQCSAKVYLNLLEDEDFKAGDCLMYIIEKMNNQWIKGCLEGETGAIEHFVGAYQQAVYRLALSILDDPEEAEDSTQETFLAALRGLASFKGDCAFTTWLYAIAINICRTRLQRRRRGALLHKAIEGLFLVHARTTVSIEETVLLNESNADVWNAIRSIDDRHRLPIILRYYHGFSVNEISELLGIPSGTVHSRLNTGRGQLRNLLKEGRK